MVYGFSPAEIDRRKRAYLTLSASVLVGMVLSSALLRAPIPAAGYLLVTAIIFLLGAFSFVFFRTLSKSEIRLTDHKLVRVVNGNPEEYPVGNINRIKTKWTTNNTIREVNIWLNGGNRVVLSALDRFDEFREELLDGLAGEARVEETQEPLDYDHPLFYSLLGLPISAFGVLIFRSIPLMSYQHIKIVFMTVVVYLFVFGLYFLAAKPLKNSYGNRAAGSDYIMGGLMICSSLVALLYFTRL